MVRMNLGTSYDSLSVDEKSSGHRQFRGVIAVESVEVNAETDVQGPEFFGQWKGQTKFFSVSVIFICKHRKGEAVLFDDLLGIFAQLGGDSNEGTSQLLYLAIDFLQSFQLHVAVGSPDTPIKTESKRPFAKKIFRVDEITIFIREGKLR